MEFLRPIFETHLDGKGAIEVAGNIFQPSQILRELDPVAYQEAFNEWEQEHRKTLSDVANNILTSYNNRDRFAGLKRAYQTGNLIPFVGAGMSMSSGYPGWTFFLQNLCSHSHVSRTALRRLLKDGLYEEAAQALHDDLGSTLFNENLESSFSHTKEIQGPVHYLPYLFPTSSVVTTNFDQIIEEIYGRKGFRIQFGDNLDEVLRQLSSGNRLLLKLHGDCSQVSGRVLLKTEYDAAYSDEGVIRRFFSRFMFRQSFLFLGCSLVTDRTIRAMKTIVAEQGAATLPRHYALLAVPKNNKRVARTKELAEANIFPIWYPDGAHEESLEALFLELLDA